MSVTALIGTDAQFHCAGTGIVISWQVDGIISTHPNVSSRGITSDEVNSSGTVQSNLTVPATSVNNGTTVRCILFSSSGLTFSNNSTLTVLPGESIYTVIYCMWQILVVVANIHGTVADSVRAVNSLQYI